MRQKLVDEGAQKAIHIQRVDDLRQFLQSQTSPLEHFDEDLFRRLIDKCSVNSLTEVMFVFKTGEGIKTSLENPRRYKQLVASLV